MDATVDELRHTTGERDASGRPDSAFSSVLRGALAMFATQPVTWAAGAAWAIWVPQLLGDQRLGQYAVLTTIASLLGTAAALGVPEFLIRQVATHPDEAEVNGGRALVLLVALGSAASVLLIVALHLVGAQIATGYLLPLALAGMVIAVAERILMAVALGQHRWASYGWLNAGNVALGTALGIAVLALGGDLTSYLSVVLATGAATLLATSRLVRVSVGRGVLDLRRMLVTVRGGLPFFGWNVALSVYGEIDKILLALLASQTVVGWYAAAYRIVFLPGFVVTLIVTPLLPVLSGHANDRVVFRETLRRSLDLVLITTVPLTVVIIGLAPMIPNALHWPAEFAACVPLMMILALHVPLVGVDVMLGTALVALHREVRWLGVGVIAAIFNSSLNLLLIPPVQASTGNGAIAAATITVLTEVLMLGGALTLLPRGTVGLHSALMAVRVAAAALAAGVAAATLGAFVSFPLAAAAAMVVYVAMAVLVRAFSPHEIAAVVRLGVDAGLGAIGRARAALGDRLT
jgi:O-antigen/teichoic acid export membrane protein